MFHTHVSSVSSVFFMLQALYPNVLKVHRVLHMDMRVKLKGREQSRGAGDVRKSLHRRAARTTFGNAGPAWPRDADTSEQRMAMRERGEHTAATDMHHSGCSGATGAGVTVCLRPCHEGSGVVG